MWCLNTPDGYLIQTERYQGQKTVKFQPELGVLRSVVMNLLAELTLNGYHVFLDNFFTSIQFLGELKLSGSLVLGLQEQTRRLNTELKKVYTRAHIMCRQFCMFAGNFFSPYFILLLFVLCNAATFLHRMNDIDSTSTFFTNNSNKYDLLW